MGGNVFKETHEVVRLSKEDYFKMVDEVIDVLSSIAATHSELSFSVVQALYEKQDFGDMDIVVNTNEMYFKDLFEVNLTQGLGLPTSRNGDVVSFLFKKFQIDLIFVPTESYSYAKNYFSWNDLGNIVGRLSKKLGFKHGHAGLYYVQRDGDVVLENHLLTTDYTKVLEILQLDVDQFHRGFDNALQMFEWAGRSPYFDPEIFKFENLNHINKVRDRKRVVYNQLVKWCVEDYKPVKERLPFPAKENRLDYVLSVFPEIKNKVEQNDLRIALKREVSKKFNGKFVMEWLPTLSGKTLGSFLSAYKESYEDSYNDFVLNSTPEEIKQDVLSFYKEWLDES